MLRGIPPELSPQLLETLAEMGHGDTITIGDAYFAAASMAKNSRLLRADGMSAQRMADAILQLMPLENMAAASVTVMGIEDGKGGLALLDMSEKLLETVRRHDEKAAETSEIVDRLTFYERAEQSFAVLATGEPEHYGCIILQKGVR